MPNSLLWHLNQHMGSEDEIVDGAKAAARILNSLPEAERKRMVERMRMADPALLAKVLRNIVTYEDILTLTAQGAQLLLKETDQNDLLTALSGSDTEIVDFVLANISERKRKLVQEELSNFKDKSPAEISEAKAQIVRTLDRLREQGLVRTGGDGDVYV